MFRFIYDFKVHEANILSDHCAVSFCIKGELFESTNSEENLNCNKSEKLSFIYKWDNNKKDSFLNIMNSDDMCNHFEHLGCNIDMSNSIEDLDSNLK